MKSIDLAVFEQNIEATRIALRDGVRSINIWNPSTGLILAEWQGNPTGVALLTQLIAELQDTLSVSNLSPFKDYLYVDLQDQTALVVIDHGDDLMQGWLINTMSVNLGVLLGMTVPNAILNIAQARQNA